MRKIPLKNYVILVILLVISIVIVLFLVECFKRKNVIGGNINTVNVNTNILTREKFIKLGEL